MANVRLIRADNFTGGLNLRADPFQLGETESPDLLNVDVDPRGGFKMRPGFTATNASPMVTVGATAFEPKRLYVYDQTGAAQKLICLNNIDDSYSSNDGSTWSALPWDGSTDLATWQASSTTATLYAVRGVGSAAYRWDGTTATALTASATGAWQSSFASPTGTHMPTAQHCAVHADKMWVADTQENGTRYSNRVRFSHPNFPESWREEDYIDVPGGGGAINWIAPWRDALLIFKEHSLWALYGYDTESFQLVQLSTVLGTRFLPAESPIGMFFFDDRAGIMLFTGDGFDSVGDRIRRATNPTTAWDNVSLAFTNSKLYASFGLFAYASAASNDPLAGTYVFDPTIDAWTKYSLADGGVPFGFVHSADRVLCAHSSEPYVLHARTVESDTWHDDLGGDPESYASWYTTRWYDAGLIAAKKMWRSPAFVTHQPDADEALTVEVYHDWEEAQPRRTWQLQIDAPPAGMLWAATATEPDAVDGWGQATWGAGAAGAQYERGRNLGLARAVQLRISGPGSVEWAVSSISFKYIPRRVR